MWAIIGPFIAKYWAKLLAAAALIGGGLYAGLKIMSVLNKGKIDRAERKAEQATTVAQHANKAVHAEKKKTEQIKSETAIKEQVRNEEESVDSAGDGLVDIANSMFNNDTETD